MKANHVTVQLDATITVESTTGTKTYPFSIEVSGAVEDYRAYDMVVNSENIDLNDAIDADDFIFDVIEQHRMNEIDAREEY